MASQRARVHRFSLDDVYAMVRAGILDEADRLELVEGVLVELNPIGPMHAGTVAWLNSHFRSAARSLEVRVQDSFLTPDGGFVQPDLMVIEPVGRERLPAAALLVVEVSDSTRARDNEKAATYAAAAVPEYWIVDVDRGELVVHRSPGAGAYASVERFSPGDTVAPLIDAAPVDVSALLGR